MRSIPRNIKNWFNWFVIILLSIETSVVFASYLLFFEDWDISVIFSLCNWVLLIIVSMLYRKKCKTIIRDKYVKLIILFLLNCIFVDYVSATLLYQQPLLGIARTVGRYGGLLVYPILLFIVDDRVFLRLRRIVIVLGIIGGLVTIVLSLSPAFVNNIIVEKRIGERFDLPRVILLFAPLVYFVLFYSFIRLIQFKEYSWGIIWIIQLYAIYFVSMTRQMMVSFLVAMLFFVVAHLKFRQMVQCTFLAAILLSITFTVLPDHLDALIESVNSLTDTSSKEYGSISIRKEAISFYWNQFRNTNYIGFGRISTAHGGSNPIKAEYESEWGGRYMEDIGLIGYFFQYGFGLIIVVILMLFCGFRDIYFVLKNVNKKVDYAVIVAIELLLVAELIRLGPLFTKERAAFGFMLYFFFLSFLKSKKEMRNVAYSMQHIQR